MKKHQNKSAKPSKTKIELKIKSKNVTNNFILTPRTVSPKVLRDLGSKLDRFVEDEQQDRQRFEQIVIRRQVCGSKGNQHRRAITDTVKGNVRKRYQQEETGTHTTFVKRVSVTHEGFNKNFSCNSLLSSQKTKHKKKTDEKLAKNVSGELSSNTFERVIGIVIKDYKEGKLKEKELKQTLLELYDRKQRRKSVGKRRRKEPCGQPFSNQFLRSTAAQTRSQALGRQRKRSNDEDDITERVLEKQGFVNKIIVKGITTSIFLKQDDSACYLKQTNVKPVQRELTFNINTSNSVKQLNQDIRRIEEQYRRVVNKSQVFSVEDLMATKIQRAWRRYRTHKLVKNIALCRSNQNMFNIMDDFTDQEDQYHTNSPIDKLSKLKLSFSQQQTKSYAELAKIVMESLQEKKISKEECLRKILSFLNVPLSELKMEGYNPAIEEQSIKKQQQMLFQGIKDEGNILYEEMIESRLKMKDQPKKDITGVQQVLEETPSNELELNSFTNKYSSKECGESGSQFYKGKSIINKNQELDKSLTFVHSQTVANQSFKIINILNIEEGLQRREEALSIRKQKQVQELTQRLFNNKINKEEYLKQKEKISKWFKYQLKQLKNVKNMLLKSCNQACKILEGQSSNLSTIKSNKMLKCLSDKYIKTKNWAIDKPKPTIKGYRKKTEKLRSELQQQNQSQDAIFQDEERNGLSSPTQNDDEQGLVIKKVQISAERLQFEMSPKMSRLEDDEDNMQGYQYEQASQIIEEQSEGIQQGLVQLETITHKFSQKFEVSPDNEVDQMEENEISLINNFVNQHNHKFKYLCLEDKEDIFQFMFLDLVLEMFTETMTGQNRVMKAAEAYINKAKRLKKIPKGIKTNIAASREYLGVLTKYILQQRKRLKNLSYPMGPSAFEMLRYMRDQIVEADDEQAVTSTLVLPIDVFQTVSRLPELELKLQKYYEDEEKEHNRLSFLKTALNINNKSLFDCLNELLDHERPYGVWGKPFPWKKCLSLDRKWGNKDEQQKLKKCIDKSVENCSYLCGILLDKEDSLFGSHRVSEDYVSQIRQDRLSKMLANELIESQERWIFYDDEETQILMEVSSYITKKLIKEIVLEMVSINMKI